MTARRSARAPIRPLPALRKPPRPGTFLFLDETIPARPAFPVIDLHNHLWGAWDTVVQVVRVMDEVGVICYGDLTANLRIAWGGGGYVFSEGDIEDFFRLVDARHPGRFFCFTTATFNRPKDKPLFTDAKAFVAQAIATLRADVKRGARGLKILKELGIHYRDGSGRLIHADDPRLAPIWDEASALGVPVLIHQADPYGFFEPVAPESEHHSSLVKYPSWSFADARFPRFRELIERRDRLVQRHPRTTFILPHGANFPENLEYVGQLLDACPNVHIDFSARIDELGRQPHTAREFLIRYQDRVAFGSDMPASAEMYRCYFRFYETFDEHFASPDYDGTFSRHRWRICGLGLPKPVLRKLYYENALRLIPGLRRDVRGRLKGDRS